MAYLIAVFQHRVCVVPFTMGRGRRGREEGRERGRERRESGIGGDEGREGGREGGRETD